MEKDEGIDETTVKSGELSRIMQELNGHIGGQAEAFAESKLNRTLNYRVERRSKILYFFLPYF
ncbi:MAG TPA: hypothetical protein VHP30_06680 [Ignavibacteriales bacterium]|nr:hypothetical protein [Ignavibacteriales bacterium]